MAKIFYETPEGKIELDDEITLLGPHPDLTGTSAESGFNPHFQRVRDPYGDRQRALERQSRKISGYSNPVDDPKWQANHWPGNKPV